jgi:hypothetical protein
MATARLAVMVRLGVLLGHGALLVCSRRGRLTDLINEPRMVAGRRVD